MSAPVERTVQVAGGPCRIWEKGAGELLGVLFATLARAAECRTTHAHAQRPDHHQIHQRQRA